jgi:Transglycosylase SLT domain
MPSYKDHRSMRMELWGLAAIAVLMILPALMLGQEVSPSSQQGPAIDHQFSAIGGFLNRKADALLAPEDESTIPKAVVKQVGGEASRPGLAVSINQSPVNNPRLSAAAARFEPLRPTLTPILQKEGVPAELAAMILIESGGNPTALSPKGARGLWQLMPDTARRYGLVVDNMRDERLDIEKSTRAAARYLSDLHLQFGSWPLALAAYNTGEQHLQRAIDRSRSAEFTVLSSLGRLPLETRNYVPAVMAAISLFGKPPVSGEYLPMSGGIKVFALNGH